METAAFKELLNRYRTGNASAEEEALLETWYMDLRKADQVILNEAELDEAQQMIWNQFVAEHQIIPVKRSLWPRMIGVAAAVAAITLGVWLYYVSNTPRHPEFISGSPLANDIAPGGNKATIKIGDGEAITLSDAKTGVVVGNDLRYSDGTAVSTGSANNAGVASEATQPHNDVTVSTPRGGTYQITLPDGTKVWLNAASVLTYTMPLNERGGIRKVQLSGEAYFEVFRNKNQPFVVSTKNLTTTVLGTHFNINAYDDENNTKATLLEGSVKVNNIILKPNQQAAVTASSKISIKEVDVDQVVDWKNGLITFKQQTIAEIMQKIARWYNVKVVYENDVDTGQTFSGKISRSSPISAVLNSLQSTDMVKFRIEGETIYVQK